MTGLILFIVVAVGLIFVIACSFWVMSGTSGGGGFRQVAPNLTKCPKCGSSLDPQLDHCPKCSLRISV